MAVLEMCPKHNMVAYLEKTEGNAEFHEVLDFLARSSIHHALHCFSDKQGIQRLKGTDQMLKKQAKPVITTTQSMG
ncbi:hypothetical protein Tco_1355353 [Tanacetum coccineum]